METTTAAPEYCADCGKPLPSFRYYTSDGRKVCHPCAKQATPNPETADIAGLVERLRSHEGIGAALAHDRGQTGRFVTAIMDEAATALQSQADALAEARVRLATMTHQFEYEAQKHSDWLERFMVEKARATTAEASLATMREALEQIAAFNDKQASERLAQTGSYASFDEPGSVEIARRALGGSNAE